MALSVMLLPAPAVDEKFIACKRDAGFSPRDVLLMERVCRAEVAARPGRRCGAERTHRARSVRGRILAGSPATAEEASISAPQASSRGCAGNLRGARHSLKASRDFHAGDSYDGRSPPINESLARKSFAADPIGRLIFCGLDSMKVMKIVGVVGEFARLDRRARRVPRSSCRRAAPVPGDLDDPVARTAPSPAGSPRRAAEGAPDFARGAVRFTTLEASLEESVAAPSFRALLFGIFAAVAVGLAMAGVWRDGYVVGSVRTNWPAHGAGRQSARGDGM